MKTITENEWWNLSWDERCSFTGIVKYVDVIEYRKNGKRHRLDGPAYETNYGYKSWHINGQRHRLDGPAIIHPNGAEEYLIYGKGYTKEQFDVVVDFMKYKKGNF